MPKLGEEENDKGNRPEERHPLKDPVQAHQLEFAAEGKQREEDHESRKDLPCPSPSNQEQEPIDQKGNDGDIKPWPQ
jgi:hypothetical protein